MSSLYLEINYAKIVGQQLDRFKIKKESPVHYNSRCPVCGDSATNASKTRFHILEKSGKLMCYCHNCNYSNSFVYFLKIYHPDLYSQFIFERYRVNGEINEPIIKTPKVTIDDTILKPVKTASKVLFKLDLPLVSDLPKEHPAALYVASRHLPSYPFQYAERFYEFASKYNPDLSKTSKDEARLIIPFFCPKGNCYAFQGRDLSGKAAQKYITIIIDAKIPKMFGLDRINFDEHVNICEGPLDSLFIPNTIASVNASLVATAEKLKSIVKKENITLIFDCEPRNTSIVKMYSEAIDKGYNVVIWQNSPDKKEDINDLVLAGKNPENIIKKRTFKGLNAQLEFLKWKRC